MPDSGLDPGPDEGFDRWTHPSVILVATDLSDLERLMPFALEQAGETGRALILLHVLAAGAGMAMDAVGNALLRSVRCAGVRHKGAGALVRGGAPS